MNHKAERTRSSLGRLLLILAMTIALVAGTALVGAQHADAADGDSSSTTKDTTVTKTVTANQTNRKDNGSYTLTLSATGNSSSTSTSSKAKVVLVIDTSSSMNEYVDVYTRSSTTPNPSDYQPGYWDLSGYKKSDYYGLVGDDYKQLYSDGQSWYYWSGWNYTRYTGNDYYTYSQQTRLEVAKTCAKNLVDKLTTGNNSGNVEVAIMTFDNNSNGTIQDFTSESAKLKTAIEGISTVSNRGTNWQDGLNQAQNLFNNQQTDSKNIIFVSDGNPTFYIGGGTGLENSQNVNECYDKANPEAESIVNSGTNLYKVGVFGNVNRMKGLGAGASGPNKGKCVYYSADDKDSLNSAFDSIVSSITNSRDISNIVVHDTLTPETDSSVTKSVKGIDDSSSASAFVYGASYKDKDGKTVTLSVNSDRTFSYNNKSYTIPAAKIDQNNQITWNPTVNGAIPNGVTYSVSCTIWPSQEAYNKVAKRMNDESVPSMGNITGDNDKGYSVPTNAASDATYDEIHTTTQSDPMQGITGLTKSNNNYVYNGVTLTRVSDTSYTATDGSTLVKDANGKWTLTVKKSINSLGSGSMAIVPAKIHVKKIWKNVDGKDINIQATGKSSENTTSYTYNKTLNKDNQWEGDIYVAPGLTVTKTVENSNEKQLNPTLTYDVTETGIDAGEYQTTYSGDSNTGISALINDGNISDPLANITITNTKIIKTGIRTENRAPFTAAVIGLGALAVVFVLRRRFVHR